MSSSRMICGDGFELRQAVIRALLIKGILPKPEWIEKILKHYLAHNTGEIKTKNGKG